MKILVAEDDALYRLLLEQTLGDWGYEVTVVADGESACRVLQEENAPRLVVLDGTMPVMDGTEVCQTVRRQAGDRYTYILMLTGRRSQEDLVRALEAGADDYVAKPFDPAELRLRLRVGRRILDLQEELIAAREAMRQQATRDALTGLWNRRYILDVLDRDVHRAWREGRPLAVLLHDVDRFKSINDTHGHLMGDAVLRETARRMEATMRPYDTLGRYGGEEFLIVLTGCDLEPARSLAERVRATLAATPVSAEGLTIPVTGEHWAGGSPGSRPRRPSGAAAPSRPGSLPRQAGGAQPGRGGLKLHDLLARRASEGR